MAGARIRLILASVLLAGWLGYLGWMAWSNARPYVRSQPKFQIAKTRYEALSRSQFLVADVDASVRVDRDGNVTDTPEILWSRDGKSDIDIRSLNIKKELEGSLLDGNGPFLVPLVRDGDQFHVARVPEMPGLGREPEVPDPQEISKDRVYHDNAQTRAQERDIRKAYR